MRRTTQEDTRKKALAEYLMIQEREINRSPLGGLLSVGGAQYLVVLDRDKLDPEDVNHNFWREIPLPPTFKTEYHLKNIYEEVS